MSQSHFIGKAKGMEGNNKRLKISVPHFDNMELIKGYAKTLIGRCMNPEEQEMKALVVNLPKVWKLENRAVGTDLGLGKFQFNFDEAEDMENVLRMQPYHFDYWMLSLERWQPSREQSYPSEIIFWVKVLGVPLEFWVAQTFESIGEALGEWLEVDLDQGRIRVKLDGYKELRFETTVDFKGGEFHDGREVLLSLKYEKLFGYCDLCFSLFHKTERCPLNPKRVERKRSGALSSHSLWTLESRGQQKLSLIHVELWYCRTFVDCGYVETWSFFYKGSFKPEYLAHWSYHKGVFYESSKLELQGNEKQLDNQLSSGDMA
ncbi:hypothetical protein Bca101_026826 [Brassica carinata]